MKFKAALILSILSIACETEEGDENTFKLLDAKYTHIEFENTVSDQENFNVLTYRNYYNGGGVAIGDINNDGLKDIYFTANMGSNKLYLNKGEFKFEEISESSGVQGKASWTTGVTMADVNADGFIDIYVCYSGDAEKQNKENELFINNGDLTFTEKAEEYGLNDPGLSTHASFFDYDLDGDLDCYVLNNSYKDPEKISLLSRERFDYEALGGDRLYQNESGKFVNVTEKSGIFSSDIGFGLGISTGDVNGDYYPDVYISNDFWERDYLYINQKDGTFKEELTTRMSYTSVSSMGSDIADIDNDGSLDIFSTDMLPPDNYRIKAATKFDEYYQFDLKFRNSYYYQFVQNCLQVNNGQGKFQESAYFSGVAATDWSWGALIFDMNLDGKKDLFVSNGVYHDITDSDFVEFIADKDQIKKVVEEKGKYDFRDFVTFLPHNQRKNYAFINKGDRIFDNQAAKLNLDQPSYSNGSAYGDLDNDGDFDLVVNNVNMPCFVYKNAAVENGGNFVKINLKGSKNNPMGLGSTVMLYQDGNLQKVQSFTSRGFESSVDSDLIFGLGQTKNVDSIRIVWPDFKSQLIISPNENSTLELQYSHANETFNPESNLFNVPFKELDANYLANAIHKENFYIDYDQDRLMPHMLSGQGPKMITGDVNGDGKEDFILAGGKGQPDEVYVNMGKGFRKSEQPGLRESIASETTAGVLFDSDKDGDLDYLAGMGGNELKGGMQAFLAKFYENDGKGNFTKNDQMCPSITGQISCIKPCDYDNDGDIDLFVGGNSVPGRYGLTPRSFVIKKEGNSWIDVTNEFTGPIGMVNDAGWEDINGDGFQDLIVVGEWMPITIFVNRNGNFEAPLVIPISEGWWNTIHKADYDQDGDMDFLLGNWGENIKLKASSERPIALYVYDFDQNERPDGIMEWYSFEDQKPYPFASKMDLTTQLPGLKKQILKYQDYATKQVADIFSKSDLEKAVKKKVVNFRTSVLVNDNGSLVLKSLQTESQMSPVFAIETGDFDHDGITDYILGGNYYKLKPEIGRHDGFHGGYFKGLGKGKFKFIEPYKSGIDYLGEVRDIKIIDNKLFIARNDNGVLVFDKK